MSVADDIVSGQNRMKLLTTGSCRLVVDFWASFFRRASGQKTHVTICRGGYVCDGWKHLHCCELVFFLSSTFQQIERPNISSLSEFEYTCVFATLRHWNTPFLNRCDIKCRPTAHCVKSVHRSNSNNATVLLNTRLAASLLDCKSFNCRRVLRHSERLIARSQLPVHSDDRNGQMSSQRVTGNWASP